jgi:hypothetical protein
VLRLASVPWLAVGAWTFAHYLGRITTGALFVALFAALNAFAWYYLNEARVYAMQLGLALGTFACAVEVVRTTVATDKPNGTALRLLALFLVLLCASSILGAFCAAFIFAAVFVSLPPRKWLALFKSAPVAALVSGVVLIALVAYYDWTRSTNARPTDVGATNAQTAVFVFYELLGFTGLGPGRIELRAQGIRALTPHLPQLLLFAAAAGFLVWQGFRELCARIGARRVLLLTTLTVIPLLLILAVGVAIRFRVLGRHLTPLAPVFVTLLVFGAVRAARGPRWQKAIPAIFLALSLASCLSVRFAERHRKDDYRNALAVARASISKGDIVWWNGDVTGPMYYQVPLATPTNRVGIYSLQNPGAETLERLPRPDVIVAITKRETYDGAGAVSAFVQEHKYQRAETFRAFEVWRRTSFSSNTPADQ